MGYLSADEVINAFVERRPNPKHYDAVCWSVRPRNGRDPSASCEGDVLYNYGTSWPLAVYLGEKGRGKKKTPLFLKNGDRHPSNGGWGPSTAGLLQAIQVRTKGPTVSRAALRAAGVDMCKLELAGLPRQASGIEGVIVDWREGEETYHLTYDRETKTYSSYDWEESVDGGPRKVDRPWTPPRQGMFVPYTYNGAEPGSGYWHVLGAVLIRTVPREGRKARHLLCSLDESRYFVSELRRPAATVDAAFRQLKPAAVKAAEQLGLVVPRQGEWFFIPLPQDTDASMARLHGMSVTAFRKATSVEALEDDRRKDNRHVARVFRKRGQTFARGKVYHKRWSWWGGVVPGGGSLGGVTHEHATVDLGDRWHRVVKNTEVDSWSMGGSFD